MLFLSFQHADRVAVYNLPDVIFFFSKKKGRKAKRKLKYSVKNVRLQVGF